MAAQGDFGVVLFLAGNGPAAAAYTDRKGTSRASVLITDAYQASDEFAIGAAQICLVTVQGVLGTNVSSLQLYMVITPSEAVSGVTWSPSVIQIERLKDNGLGTAAVQSIVAADLLTPLSTVASVAYGTTSAQRSGVAQLFGKCTNAGAIGATTRLIARVDVG